ncbi:MAG: hypothetical protein R6T85_01120 [Egibacteraceae bacterium]
MTAPRTDATADLARVVRGALVLAASTRVAALAFSTPYLLAWTAGLDPSGRIGLALAHGATLLAAGVWSSLADAERGHDPRLSLARDPRWVDLDLARVALGPLLIAAVLGSLVALRLHLAIGLGALALLVLARLWTRAPRGARGVVGPEVVGPALVVLAPAAGLRWLAGGDVPVLSVASAAACLAALVLAIHLRDHDRDVAEGVPTLATRRPRRAAQALGACGAVGGLSGIATLMLPLGAATLTGLVGGLGVIAALPLARGRVPALAAAHALLALSWLAR